MSNLARTPSSKCIAETSSTKRTRRRTARNTTQSHETFIVARVKMTRIKFCDKQYNYNGKVPILFIAEDALGAEFRKLMAKAGFEIGWKDREWQVTRDLDLIATVLATCLFNNGSI